MSEETQRRIGKLYREGYFKGDEQAKKWSEEFPEEVKKEEKVVKKRKK